MITKVAKRKYIVLTIILALVAGAAGKVEAARKVKVSRFDLDMGADHASLGG